jgi:membrane-bound lytic murein transglycosylase A
MSMQRIRDYMAANPEAAKELRRQNKAYVFFREVQLSDKDEAVGAQGIPLTAGRSIAVDRILHVYGTPFFIEANLPIESERSQTPFRRLMVSQDTGSAIVGPARADIYFGAGAEAGRVSGRLKHGARFVMLVPKSLDPVAAGRRMILPEARPSAKIAKLFPPAKDAPKEPAKAPEVKGETKAPSAADTSKEKTAAVAPATPPAAVPLPQARPDILPQRRKKYRRYHR